MFESAKGQLSQELDAIRDACSTEDERIIVSDQAAKIMSRLVSPCSLRANNYLGLSNNPELIDAAKAAMDQYGFGSPRRALSAVPRISTRASRQPSRPSLRLKTPSFTPLL